MKTKSKNSFSNTKLLGHQKGVSLVELVIGLAVLSVVFLSFLMLFTSLVNSSVVAKRKSIATSIATTHIEYLKSLPYDLLAVQGGSIYSANPLPATKTETVDGFRYTIKTSINYIDDAFDGCMTYPSQELKEKLCRNYPPPASQINNDTNAADYKIINVKVENDAGNRLIELGTQIASRVAETSSTTGAMIINVIDDNGNPIQGANVNLTNSTLNPVINLSDSSDANGIAIFYNLPTDTSGFDYKINASKLAHSTLETIKPSGSLQPTYPSQNVISQQSSYVTIVLRPQNQNSIIAEAFTTTGAPISNLRIALKGGYKSYSLPTNTAYYYDNTSPDNRPTTDASGLFGVKDLTPGPYFFCGDTGTTSCRAGSTNHYLVAAIPYNGYAGYNPTLVPTTAESDSFTSYIYNGDSYKQKVRLIFSTSSSFPRISTISTSEVSLSGSTLSNFDFSITGSNLPCSSSSCQTSVRVVQASNTYTATCSGISGNTRLDCYVNLSGISIGSSQLVIQNSGGTYTSPADLPLGGFNVVP